MEGGTPDFTAYLLQNGTRSCEQKTYVDESLVSTLPILLLLAKIYQSRLVAFPRACLIQADVFFPKVVALYDVWGLFLVVHSDIKKLRFCREELKFFMLLHRR
jgi:hypothetical protein